MRHAMVHTFVTLTVLSPVECGLRGCAIQLAIQCTVLSINHSGESQSIVLYMSLVGSPGSPWASVTAPWSVALPIAMGQRSVSLVTQTDRLIKTLARVS